VKELLFSITKKDFEITYFSGTGKGGQHRNKHQNCVRIKHLATGLIGIGQVERSLEQNKKQAFLNLTNNKKFKTWLKIEASRAMLSKEEVLKKERELEDLVDKMMQEENLKIEYLKES
jgi:peptide chain release factor 1